MRRPALIRVALATATAVAGAGLAGCGNGSDGPQIDSSPTPAALTVAVTTLPHTLDPALARTPSERAVAAAINTPLLTYRRSTDTDAATLEPALATDLPKLSPDHTEYRFTLRPGLLYADGRVVTASDVERSISHASVDAADPELREVLSDIVGAPSKDGQTLPGVVSDDGSGVIVVRLRHPDGLIPFALADPATAPLPALPSSDLQVLPSSTTGPLRVARVTGSSIELVANPLRARISTVPAAATTHVSITDRKPTARALATGSVDLVLDPAAGPVPAKTARVDASSGAVWSLLLPARGLLADRTLRQAIADAIDRRDLAANADPTAVSTTPTGRGSASSATTGNSSSATGTSTTPTSSTATTPKLPPTPGGALVDEDLDGGLLPACGLLPAYVVGAVVRDDCPPSPSIAKNAPLTGDTLHIAVAGDDLADVQLANIVSAAVSSLGGRAVFRRESSAPGSAAIDSTIDGAIVRASPAFPHPAGWLGPAGDVDDLVAREVATDQEGPLTGSSHRWSALETRAVQRAVDIPLAVGRTAVVVGVSIEKSSVLIHPVLGLDLTALAAR